MLARLPRLKGRQPRLDLVCRLDVKGSWQNGMLSARGGRSHAEMYHESRIDATRYGDMRNRLCARRASRSEVIPLAERATVGDDGLLRVSARPLCRVSCILDAILTLAKAGSALGLWQRCPCGSHRLTPCFMGDVRRLVNALRDRSA
jgi:hypothetical protein